ncbi:MAG: hypothetical protein A2Y15_02870 [Clostridiales bacterium GWF2_36_10]|nr:MAG: hypothetical protein A2Y15_02870 [Clostridiales bacterium GWF2_36_10]HAN20916.1 hypothetical protein [Clostridiales bacterium]
MNTERNILDILFSGFQPLFMEFAQQLFNFETEITRNEYDIIVIGESGGDLTGEISCNYIICPQSMKINGRIKSKSVITCGMNTRCTLSFSSIAYDKALLSINRRIDLESRSIHQCEKPVDYYEPLTVYENLVVQGLNILTI